MELFQIALGALFDICRMLFLKVPNNHAECWCPWRKRMVDSTATSNLKPHLSLRGRSRGNTWAAGVAARLLCRVKCIQSIDCLLVIVMISWCNTDPMHFVWHDQVKHLCWDLVSIHGSRIPGSCRQVGEVCRAGAKIFCEDERAIFTAIGLPYRPGAQS